MFGVTGPHIVYGIQDIMGVNDPSTSIYWCRMTVVARDNTNQLSINFELDSNVYITDITVTIFLIGQQKMKKR